MTLRHDFSRTWRSSDGSESWACSGCGEEVRVPPGATLDRTLFERMWASPDPSVPVLYEDCRDQLAAQVLES